MKILWTLEEPNNVDPDDLLGNIYLQHNEQEIRYDCTYLNNWFDGLIEGYLKLKTGEIHIEVDLIVEPNLLALEKIGENGIVISYEGKSLPPCGLNAFFEALYNASWELIQLLDKKAIGKNRTIVRNIEEFVLDYRSFNLKN